MPRNNITVPLQVDLRRETVDKYEEIAKGQPLADLLSTRAKLILENIADGAVLLTADQVSAIEATTRKPVKSGKDIVLAAQKGVGIEDGQNVIKHRVDPAFIDALRLRAQEAGRSLDDLFSDAFDIALENQWVYGIDPVGFRRTFTPKQIERISDVLGRDTFEVEDLVVALERQLQEA